MAEEVLEEEQEEEECPKCPPAGAPAWMATFADMATLLMAFLFLFCHSQNLTFPNLNKYGSLKEALVFRKLFLLWNSQKVLPS